MSKDIKLREGSLKKTLYLPIEIKAREFNSKLLLACFAAREGYRVYLGRKSDVDRILLSKSRVKGGVYLYKSGNLRSRLESIKKSVDSLVVLDEEMGVALKDPEFYYKQRIANTESIDRYFVISEKHRRIAGRIWPELGPRIKVTGWPRVDMWRPEMCFFYSAEVERIKSQNGNFYLFSSDFGILNDKSLSFEVDRLRRSVVDVGSIEKTQEIGAVSIVEYKSFIEVLKRFDAQAVNQKIIVRPHPSEDHQQWYSDLKHLKNVFVVYSGEITPWVLASQGVIHRGCTTAVQAYVSGVPSIYYAGSKSHVSSDGMPKKVSTIANSIPALIEIMSQISSGSYSAPDTSAFLDDELHVGEHLSVELIVNEINNIDISLECSYQQVFFSRIWGALGSFLRSLRLRYGWINKDKMERYFRKFPNDIKADEVIMSVRLLFPNEVFLIEKVLDGVVKIEN